MIFSDFFVVSRIIRNFVVMKQQTIHTINIHGHLLSLSVPQVMGILNITPDSFFAGSRKQSEHDIAERAVSIVREGGTMIDVGAFSTRPGADDVSEQEEMARLRHALPIVRRECPDVAMSVDTFRPDVAKMAVEEFGADIINDVSDGGLIETVPLLRVPYILMSVQSNVHDMLLSFAGKVQLLRDKGQKDIILDPGFGFGKELRENYRVLHDMERLHSLNLPLLVGVSRKRMIHQLLDVTVEEALNGTTAVHVLALMKGASILRVHDVREAVQAVKVVRELELASVVTAS